MENIIEYRDDQAPANEYPQRIISPTAPLACCMDRMEPIGHRAIDANWRFFYKRCRTCGFTVRCFYAPSLIAVFEAASELRLRLAEEMNPRTGTRKRWIQAEIEADVAAARGRLVRPKNGKPVPSAA